MKKILLGSSKIKVPAVAIGCMRMNNMEPDEIEHFIGYAVEHGGNFFDHADIYGKGKCEELFGNAWTKLDIDREDLFLQTKCGIIPGKMYDLSKEHIIESVENSLRKLKTDYIDMLLLHRPDALVDPEEVAAAFDKLHLHGKVRMFGVSNHSPMQMELLKKYVTQPLMANQLQFGLGHNQMIAAGMEINMIADSAVDRDGAVLDYCRLNDVTIQAWSPFGSSKVRGSVLGNKTAYYDLNKVVDRLADEYDTTNTGIATAWILRHPAHIQMITGTTRTTRLEETFKASEIELTREEWYELYLSSGHMLP